ncbi:superoxide dismutase [Flavobacterium sp.]|uniref:superoxide dismutase n=1 Tax=Flavobacterium sp. TaxID=239 RepID=UPI002B4B0213|nr:superoxide dismutase [Flavobacterium sp.]HLF53223.1 superoxide dismutase [Flavobacterium sp.]
MKKTTALLLCFSFLLMLPSCNNKKLTEVVEVPLPSAQEKISIGNPDDVKADAGTFEMAKLPYSYDALAPNIDARTMEIHYSKHYLTYTNNLNKAIAGTDFKQLTIEEILSKSVLDSTDLRNNAGGYYNHSLFWECMGPKAGGQPKDTLAAAITKDFGSFENFKSQFKNAATKQFGSGWAWLIVDKTGKLQVTSTPNQDNPLMPNVLIPGTPILALDVWEHAYYLDYQYKRKNYIDAFFNIINWDVVEKKYKENLK